MLGVGSRVTVISGDVRSDRVTLTDDSGTSMLATVAHGVEVEILAWRPRRGGDTRYRVVTTGDRVEGWLGAASLQARQLPPAPKPAPAAVPAAIVSPRRAPAQASSPTAPAAAKRVRKGTR